MLKQRSLGRCGLTVAEIGSGTMGRTAFYGFGGTCDEPVALIRRAHELGVTLFDNPELYDRGDGFNEIMLGQAFARSATRCRSTKFRFTYDERGNANGHDASPANICRVAENNLRYLRTDAIDVLYKHRQDPKIPVEDVAGTVKELIAEGKAITSDSVRPGLRRCAAPTRSSPVSVLQTGYSLFERGVRDRGAARGSRVGHRVALDSPLGRGFPPSAVKPGRLGVLGA